MDRQEPSLFYHCIQAVLKSWTALQMAVSCSFGGPHSSEKAQWLVGVVETFFKENKDIESFELEDFMREIMSEEFNTHTEDGSMTEIANNICVLYRLWSNGKQSEMKEYVSKLPLCNLGECMSGNNKNSSTNSNEEDQKILDQLTICQPSSFEGKSSRDVRNSESTNDAISLNDEEEDGWTRVVTRKKRPN